MKNRYVLYCLFVIFLTACAKNEPLADVSATTAEEKVYVIKKGNHAAEGNNFQLLHTSLIRCQVRFDSTAIYSSANAANQLDVNKLIGFSDCNDEHHQNSARLGWSWNGKAVAVYAYAYINGERVIKPMAEVHINQPVNCSVRASGNQYFFSVGDTCDSLPRHCNAYNGVRYKLYPYFGGDEVAPHDVTIAIKTLIN